MRTRLWPALGPASCPHRLERNAAAESHRTLALNPVNRARHGLLAAQTRARILGSAGVATATSSPATLSDATPLPRSPRRQAVDGTPAVAGGRAGWAAAPRLDFACFPTSGERPWSGRAGGPFLESPPTWYSAE